MELDNKTYEQIMELCAAGDSLAEKQAFGPAITEYEKAWELIPEPKSDWDASVWVLTALGDAYFFLKEYSKGSNYFQQAYNKDFANPFILMRLGQCLFEINQVNRAEDFLMRAYMMEGEELFENDHSKYLDHMRKKFGL
jgi:tetratricopeptide (TPR) repeat protein